MSDLTDMKQLEYLLRLSIMAAKISGQGHPTYLNYCYSAYGYMHRMWQVNNKIEFVILFEIEKYD